MKELRNWEQMKRDNIGAAWIVNGEFCGNYIRTSQDGRVNEILERYRETGLEEWQLCGFNGCWSCDHWFNCHLPQANNKMTKG